MAVIVQIRVGWGRVYGTTPAGSWREASVDRSDQAELVAFRVTHDREVVPVLGSERLDHVAAELLDAERSPARARSPRCRDAAGSSRPWLRARAGNAAAACGGSGDIHVVRFVLAAVGDRGD